MVKEIVDSVFPISVNSLKKIEVIAELVNIEKDEIFIKKDRRNDKEYFLLEGICKSYLISPEGEEITISFFTEKSILSPHTTRTKEGFSVLHFKALTDIKMIEIDAKAFEGLMIDDLAIRHFGNTVLQNELLSKVEKEIGLASLTAKERLIEFRKNYRLLENLIPHTDIASYLGITNISLSRLRRELIE